MFIAALAHKYSFPHEPYHINITDYGNERTWVSALSDVFSLSDVHEDVSEHLGVLGSSLSRRLRGRTAYHLTPGVSESEHLMSNSILSQSANGSNGSGSGGGYQASTMNYNLVPSTSDSDVSTASTTKIRYGSVEGKAQEHAHGKKDGITIVKQWHRSKDYSPQYGVPKIVGNYFAQQELPIVHQHLQTTNTPPSTRSDDRRPSRSEQTTASSSTTTTASGPLPALRKSDSMASDWLSTPTDEFMGIDVKGLEKGRIDYKGDPKI